MSLSTLERQSLANNFNATRNWKRDDWLEENLPDAGEASIFLWEAARHGDIELEHYNRHLMGDRLQAMRPEDVQLMIDGVLEHADSSHPHIYDWDEPLLKAMDSAVGSDPAWLLDRWASFPEHISNMAAFSLAMQGKLASTPEKLLAVLTYKWLNTSSMYEAQLAWWTEVRARVCAPDQWLASITAVLDKDIHVYDWDRIVEDLKAAGPQTLIKGALRYPRGDFRRGTYDALVALGTEHIPSLEAGLDEAYAAHSMFGQAALVLPLVELYRQAGMAIPESVDAALVQDLHFYSDDDIDLSRQALANLDVGRQTAIIERAGTYPRGFLVLDMPQNEALIASLVAKTEAFDAKDKNKTGLAVRGLVACGELAVPSLVAALKTPKTKGALGIISITALAKIKSKSPEAAEVLVACLGHSAKAMRTAADQGLADLGESARAALEAGTKARKKAVREACEAALARLNPSNTQTTPLDEVESLYSALDDAEIKSLRQYFEDNQEWHLREAAAKALREKGLAAFAALCAWYGEKPERYQSRGLFAGVIEQGFADDPMAAWAAVDVFARNPKLSKYAVKEVVRALKHFGPHLRDPLIHALGSASTQAVYLYELLAACGADLGPARAVLVKGMQESSKTIREACLEGLKSIGPEVSADVLPLIASRKKDARLGAATVLAHFPTPDAAEALRKALDKEKSDEVATALELALNACGGPQSTSDTPLSAEDIDALLAGQRKARLPAFLALDKLPDLHLAAGGALSEDARRGLLTRLMKEGPEVEDAIARQVRPHLDDGDCNAWSVSIKDQWASSGGNARHKWAIFQQAIMANEARLSTVGPRLDEMTSDGLHALAGWYLEVFARHTSTTGHAWIGYWDTHARRRGLKNKARELLTRLSEAAGLDPGTFKARLNPFIADDVEDARIPQLDFDKKGEQALSYGDRGFVLRLAPDLGVAVFDDAGTKIKSLPRIKASDDKVLAGDARAALATAKQKLKPIAPRQRARMEAAMVGGRTWGKASFEALFRHHPLMGALGQALVFITDAGVCFTVSAARDFVDVEGSPLVLPEQARVEIAHTTALSDAQRQAWADTFTSRGFDQPFEQLDREVFTASDLGDDPIFDKTNPRTFSKRLEEKGWRPHRPEDAGMVYGAVLPLPARGVEATISHEGYPVSLYGGWDDIAIESLAFYDPKGASVGYDEVHPAAFSEVVRDLRWLGLSI